MFFLYAVAYGSAFNDKPKASARPSTGGINVSRQVDGYALCPLAGCSWQVFLYAVAYGSALNDDRPMKKSVQRKPLEALRKKASFDGVS